MCSKSRCKRAKTRRNVAPQPLTGLREEGVESVVAAANRLVRRHLPVGLDAVLQAVELPAGVADLDTGLTDVDRDDLTHGGELLKR